MIRNRTIRGSITAAATVSIAFGAAPAVSASAAAAPAPQASLTAVKIGNLTLTSYGVGELQVRPATADAPEAVPVSADAAAVTTRAAGDAQITNSTQSISSLGVCQHWNAQNTCGDSSYHSLSRGQNTYSKFSWPDSDGFDCLGSAFTYRVMSSYVTCSTPRWIKVSGGLIGRINVPIIVS
jgi:hypothetical protein